MNQYMISDFEPPWWVHQKTLARASNQAAAATAPGSSATTLTFFIHKGCFFSNIPPDFQCQISQPELLSPKKLNAKQLLIGWASFCHFGTENWEQQLKTGQYVTTIIISIINYSHKHLGPTPQEPTCHFVPHWNIDY